MVRRMKTNDLLSGETYYKEKRLNEIIKKRKKWCTNGRNIFSDLIIHNLTVFLLSAIGKWIWNNYINRVVCRNSIYAKSVSLHIKICNNSSLRHVQYSHIKRFQIYKFFNRHKVVMNLCKLIGSLLYELHQTSIDCTATETKR